MSYEQFLAGNDPNECGDPVSIDIHTWSRDGERLIGELREISDFTGGSFEQKCKRYLFATDNGLVTTILGASIDKQIQPEKYIGRVLCITYKGKITLDDGRSCNRFTVVDLTDAFKDWQKKPKTSKPQTDIPQDHLDYYLERPMEEEINGTKSDKTQGQKKAFFGKK